MDGQIRRAVKRNRVACVKRGHLGVGDVKLGKARPGRVDRLAVAELVGGQPHRGGLDPQRHVLADQDHVQTFDGKS